MPASARDVRAAGCPVLLSAPFTGQIHDAHRWQSWAGELGGGSVRLVWVRSDVATLRHRRAARGLDRESAQPADLAKFRGRIRTDSAPASPRAPLDNRLSSTPHA